MNKNFRNVLWVEELECDIRKHIINININEQ
jgi:hypothetical protein